MPVQPCVMRPMRSTPVASTTTSDAPEFASMPRCVVCHGVGTPSSALYWHIGATTMRLARSRPASLIGEKSALVMGKTLCGSERLFGGQAARRRIIVREDGEARRDEASRQPRDRERQ